MKTAQMFFEDYVAPSKSATKSDLNVSDVFFSLSVNRPFSKMAAENSNKLKLADIKNVNSH